MGYYFEPCAWCGGDPNWGDCCPAQHHDAIFVFGSNLAGIHGAGAARYASIYKGAIWGQGEGFQGRSYAIPTKDRNIRTISLEEIRLYVTRFIRFAGDGILNGVTFAVTAIGTGLAGYKHEQIAPMFKHAPDNCFMPPEWKDYL